MSEHIPVMPAGLVLDSRTELLTRLGDKNFFRQVAFLLASQSGDIPANGWMTKSTAEQNRVIDKHSGAVSTLANHLTVAEAYRVSPDMSAMVQFAASQLDDSDEVDASLAPTQCGFVRFDKPLPVQDIRGKTMLVNWLVWGPYRVRLDGGKVGRPCTVVWAFNDPRSTPDDTHRELVAMAEEEGRSDWYSQFVGRFATVGVDFLFTGRPVGSEMIPANEKHAQEVLNEGIKPLPGTNTVRYIHALWLLLNQTVTKVEDEQADRPARRRAGKAKLPDKVTVIRLRREESTLDREPGESMVEWQHRWIVRGHWRWQACGAGRTERRRIWINPFVKGPEGAPLKQSEKVYSLDR